MTWKGRKEVSFVYTRVDFLVRLTQDNDSPRKDVRPWDLFYKRVFQS